MLIADHIAIHPPKTNDWNPKKRRCGRGFSTYFCFFELQETGGFCPPDGTKFQSSEFHNMSDAFKLVGVIYWICRLYKTPTVPRRLAVLHFYLPPRPRVISLLNQELEGFLGGDDGQAPFDWWRVVILSFARQV